MLGSCHEAKLKKEEKEKKKKRKVKMWRMRGTRASGISSLMKKEKEAKKEKTTSKVVGWSTKKMEEQASKHEFKDMEELVHTMCGENWQTNLRKKCWTSTK